MVAFGVVGTETNQLSVTRGELRLKLGESTEFSGANGREIVRVTKQDSPLVANELVEVDGAVGSVGVEIGGCGAKTEAERQSVHSKSFGAIELTEQRGQPL
jgi:hypothetical protein